MMRHLICLLLLMFGIPLAQPALAADSADPGPLRIGVLVYRGLERAVSDWQSHADYLTKRLAPLRFEIVPLTLAEFAPAVAERRIDLLITNTGHYVELEADGTVARIATMRIAGPHGPVDRFGGTLIVQAGREDIHGYGDLRGKRLAVPDTRGFGGWQVHLPEARNAGIDLQQDTRRIIEIQNQEKVISAVLNGEADAGFVRSDLIESLAAAGKLSLDALQVIGARKSTNFPYAHSTQLYPHWPFARLDHVSEEIARNLLIALLELPPGHPAARAAGIYGWTLPHNYQSVLDLFLEFRLGPYADMPVRFSDVMSRYGNFILISVALFITLLLASLIWILRVNLLLRNNTDKLQLAAGVFEHAQEGIIITDAKGNIIEANDTFLAVTGYPRNEVIGQNPRFLSSGKQDKDFYRDMWRMLHEKGFWRGELWNRRKDGSSYFQQTSISAVRGEDGEIRHFIGLSSDISELKESQSKLEHMAYFDALTGLPNRRMLSDRLHQAIALAQRNERMLAVCYLDLDGFKPINDNWGHAAGDRLLVEVASRLMSSVRGGDTVCRLGGDEFVVLLGNLALIEECDIALERMRQTLCAPFTLPDGVATLSASIGVTLFPMDGADPDALIRHADQAMYASKLAGRNRYTLFDIESDQLSEAREESRQDILRGLECNEFVLYYQPKVNMRTGVISGAEALIRWQHPERGLLQPADFLPVVDFVGMQSEIGLWVLESALQQMEIWHMQGLDILVSVNIAADQLQSEGFFVSLREVLARHPNVPAVQLELEILETAALDDLTHVADVIQSCHEMGVHFALDDFGTGYSSLTYLKQLQADTLKIDQSFIRDMLDDPDDLAIVDGIVGLASAFRREVVAEGVETPAHGRMLLQLGCETAQGYGIAKPMAADQFPAWLHSWRQPDEWRGVNPWPREDLPLLTVEVDHLRWVRQFAAALQTEGGGMAHWPQLDHQECRFGLWLKHSGKAKYGNLAAFERMAAAHSEVHVVGAAIVRDYEVNPALARERVHEIHVCRDQLLGCLAALRSEARLPAA
jgi:diguanylate cyclase (GGDEF)-like protein/PAS domain S-box-containing protein